jgi:hypothetical protein
MKRLSNWFNERVLFIGIAILLFFIPLYPKFPLFNVPNTYVAIRFEDFLVAFLITVFAVKCYFGKIKVFKERLNRLFFLYFIVGGLSSVSAILITQNVFPHLVILHWLRHIEYMSLFFVASLSITKIQDLKDYLKMIILATVGVIIYGLGQKFLGFPVISTMNEEFSKGLILSLTEWARISSTFAGHYDLATYLVMVLAVITALVVGMTKIYHKLLTFLLGIITYYLLILTASQISIFAYFVSVTLVLLMSKKYFWIVPVIVISLVGLFASKDLTQRYATTIRVNRDMFLEAYENKVQEWMTSRLAKIPTVTPTPILIPSETTDSGGKSKGKVPTPTPTPITENLIAREKRYVKYESSGSADIIDVTAYRSVAIRLNAEWPRSLRALYKNPILGTGYSSITLATDNDYLRMLGETGILGFLTMMILFIEIFRRFFHYFLNKKFDFQKVIVIGIFSGIIGFLINAFFIDVLEASKVDYVFWMLVGIMIAIIKLSISNDNQQKYEE